MIDSTVLRWQCYCTSWVFLLAQRRSIEEIIQQKTTFIASGHRPESRLGYFTRLINLTNLIKQFFIKMNEKTTKYTLSHQRFFKKHQVEDC